MRRFASLISCLAVTAPAVNAAEPATTSADAFAAAKMMSGDCRLVILGDSFAFTTYQRVFCSVLNVWDASPLTATYIPAGTRTKLGQGAPLASPFTDIAAESATAYETLLTTGASEFVTLPVRGVLGFEGGPTLTLGPSNTLLASSVRNSTLKNTPGGRMFAVGDRVLFRGVYWAPTNTALMHDSLGLLVGAATLDTFDPTSEARPLLHLGEAPNPLGRPPAPGRFNAFARDIDFTIQQGNSEGYVSLTSPTGPPAAGAFVHTAGGVYAVADSQTGDRLPGLYYSALADSSWSYAGFGGDTAPTFPLDKVYTQDQLTHWLDVTTLDAAQPTLFVYYLAVEPDNQGNAPARIEAMIDQSQASAAAVGLVETRHLLVMPHFHRIPGVTDDAVLRSRFEQQRDAMFEIAARRAEVSAVSIYDATEGVLLEGSPEARSWLRTNAPTPFEYTTNTVDLADGPLAGDLLDSIGVHPANQDAATYFASLFVDALLAPLALDFNNDGILDNGDINGFVLAFLGSQLSADLNGDGVLDNGDITCFVTRFLAEI